MPGDIKYKDVNGDGKIDGNDQVAIGATTKPNLIYGFGIAANWKGLDVNLHFQEPENQLILSMAQQSICSSWEMAGKCPVRDG